ncbi:unnamed protein product, partial [Thlaspi arvense]
NFIIINMSSRQVIKKILANFESESDGAVIRQGITKSDHELLDPFVSLVEFSGSILSCFALFLDQFHLQADSEIILTEVKSANSFFYMYTKTTIIRNVSHVIDQLCAGFESVTYMLQGGIIHQDFNGHSGTIHEGDVQWMTAGRGIIHSEMPEKEINSGLQLWINLPSDDKMIDPKSLEISISEIPRAEEEGVEVKVIAGESMGVQSPFYTKTPIMFLDVTLQPRGQINQTIPESWTAFAYVIEGDDGVFSSSDSSTVEAHNVVVFGTGKLACGIRQALGEPIGEPVVQHEPFVMNSQAEIDMAIEDYRNAKNGFEMAKNWRSE